MLKKVYCRQYFNFLFDIHKNKYSFSGLCWYDNWLFALINWINAQIILFECFWEKLNCTVHIAVFVNSTLTRAIREGLRYHKTYLTPLIFALVIYCWKPLGVVSLVCFLNSNNKKSGCQNGCSFTRCTNFFIHMS